MISHGNLKKSKGSSYQSLFNFQGAFTLLKTSLPQRALLLYPNLYHLSTPFFALFITFFQRVRACRVFAQYLVYFSAANYKNPLPHAHGIAAEKTNRPVIRSRAADRCPFSAGVRVKALYVSFSVLLRIVCVNDTSSSNSAFVSRMIFRFSGSRARYVPASRTACTKRASGRI